MSNWEIEERISFTWVSGSTITGVTRWLSKTADPATAGTGQVWIAGTKIKLVAMHDQMLDKLEGDDALLSAVVYADTTARDAALWGDGVATKNYTNVKTTADGLFWRYNTTTNVWETYDTGTVTPNASTTVAGSVELPTDTQVQNETDTWETWAKLAVTPSQLSPTKLTEKTSLVWDDLIRIADSGASNVAKKVKATTIVDLIKDKKYIFWDGSDGNVVISSNTTLTRDMFYNNLTINNGFVLSPDGYKIYVKWTLTNNWTIRRNWNNWWNWGNASASTGWTAGAAGVALNAGTLWDSVAWWVWWAWVTGFSQGNGWGAGVSANPSYSATNGSKWWNWWDANGWGANVAWWDGWVSTRWTLYNKVFTLDQILSNLSNPASTNTTTLNNFLWATLYKWPWSWWGWASWDSETGTDASWWGWGWWTAWGLIWIAARIIDNTNWVIESKWWNWWNWWLIFDGWGVDIWGSWWWAGGNWGVIYLIYETLTAIWTTTLTWWTGWTASAWTWGGGDNWANGANWSTGDLIQITV